MRVRKFRRARGMSQQDLARKAGMHRTHLVRFEGGKVNLTLDAFFALARGLGVQPAELLPCLGEQEDTRVE
ncbi:MAG: helix-turn-helix domain-containing protein [Myxococcota bacterium]